MYISYIIFASICLFYVTEAAVELSVGANDKTRALPLKGISEETNKVIDKERGKERGWHNWGSPQWGEPDNDFPNSGSQWQEPSVLPLPSFSHGGGHSGGHNGGGHSGHNSFNDVIDQSNDWADQSSDLLPPSSFSEPERHSNGWGSDSQESNWLPDSNGGSGDSNEPSEPDWDRPQWSSHSGGHNSKPCNCAKEGHNTFNSYNQPPPPVNYPQFPSGPNYAPIRPNKHHRSPAWSHWDNVPWNNFEKGTKDKNHIKGGETAANVEEVVNKSEANQEIPENVNLVNERQNIEELSPEDRVVPPVPTSVVV